MRAMISKISGCIIGSPPEIVITDDPNSASLSILSSIVSIGTGSLVLSYSLQYVHDKLHRRIGTMCTSTGCFVDANARTVCRTPRVNLLKLLAFGIDQIWTASRTGNYKSWDTGFQTQVKSSDITRAGAFTCSILSSL